MYFGLKLEIGKVQANSSLRIAGHNGFVTWCPVDQFYDVSRHRKYYDTL